MMYTPARYNDFGFDNFFNDFAFPPLHWDKGMKPFPEMRTDIKETENGYELAIDIPGVKKENIKAQIKNGYLTVTAENNEEKEEKDEKGKFLRRERHFGTMSRSYYVGDGLTEEDIKANFADGTLNLQIPKEVKKEVPEEKFIAIEG